MRLAVPSTPRQKITFSTSLTLVVTIVLLAFVTVPSIRQIKQLNEQIETQRTELEALYSRGQLLRQTLKEYQEVKPTVATLERVYVGRGDELSFITALEGIANANQLNQEIKLGAPDPKKPTTTSLPIQLELTGELPTFMKYLVGLEALDYYLNIDTIRLSGNTRSGNQTNEEQPLSALLLANAYYKP